MARWGDYKDKGKLMKLILLDLMLDKDYKLIDIYTNTELHSLATAEAAKVQDPDDPIVFDDPAVGRRQPVPTAQRTGGPATTTPRHLRPTGP